MDILDFNNLAQMSEQQLMQLFGVRDYYVYQLNFGQILSGDSAQSSFTIQVDSNFLWQESNFVANLGTTQTEASRVLGGVTCLIQDTSSGRQLSSAPVPLIAQFGYGSLPAKLPSPRFFRANTQVTVSLTNESADTITSLYLSFIGTKFFKFAQQ